MQAAIIRFVHFVVLSDDQSGRLPVRLPVRVQRERRHEQRYHSTTGLQLASNNSTQRTPCTPGVQHRHHHLHQTGCTPGAADHDSVGHLASTRSTAGTIDDTGRSRQPPSRRIAIIVTSRLYIYLSPITDIEHHLIQTSNVYHIISSITIPVQHVYMLMLTECPPARRHAMPCRSTRYDDGHRR